MAGIIVADTIQSGGSFIRLNSASQTVATINAAGIYANTGNLLIAANGTIGVASITNTAITGTMTQAQIGSGVTTTGPAFSAYISSNQSISPNVWTKAQFNTEEFDTANCFNTSTYRFTPNVAGYYQINLEIYTSGSGSTQGNGMIYKNGAAAKGSFAGISNGQCSVIPALIYLNGSTDYIEAYGYIGTASGVIAGDANYCYFQAWLARAA